VTLVLYYHELSEERSPLCVSPRLFTQHLETLAACGATTLTAGELADALAEGGVPERTVVLTFDDAFAAAVREARPRLDAAGMRATFFCVAGHIGGRSDWASRTPDAPVGELASADELRALAVDGHELGSHGWSHAPLDGEADVQREVVESKHALAAAADARIRSFAYPYGAAPTAAVRAAVADTYDISFGTTIGRVDRAARHDLPRVDAHYVRDPRLLRRVVLGSFDAYLRARRLGSRTRRIVRKDYTTGATQ
jgi:peptidoglycan/xylan/chitin deacetylase (PgdA/CDA1 family)